MKERKGRDGCVILSEKEIWGWNLEQFLHPPAERGSYYLPFHRGLKKLKKKKKTEGEKKKRTV